MAKPNYEFEKRQREMRKKQKKAEKTQRKALTESPPAEPVADEAPVQAKPATE